MKISKFSVLALSVALALTSGCTYRHPAPTEIQEELVKASRTPGKLAVPEEVLNELNPDLPVQSESFAEDSRRISVAANEVPAAEFFARLMDNSGASVVVHPEVSGTITVNLDNVTVDQVFDAVYRMYGYRAEKQGKIYFVYPAGVHTETIPVDYMLLTRESTTSVSISNNSLKDGDSSSDSSSSSGSSLSSGSSSDSESSDSTSGVSLSTNSKSDFWTELEKTLGKILGSGEGRMVSVNPQAATVTVRGMPSEIQNVRDYLNQTRNALRRQVVIEAKILEVHLNEDYAQGIDWSLILGNPNSQYVKDMGTRNTSTSHIEGSVFSLLGGGFQFSMSDKRYSVLINLLQTQGDVTTLSSPRITALNNQRSVMKIGKDSYYLTDISTDSNTSSSDNNIVSSSFDFSPFFSGVSLDVLPQISDDGRILMHVHPAVISVQDDNKTINLGDGKRMELPLATSDVRETDTVVEAQSGDVILIGGLMRHEKGTQESKVPVLGDIPVVGELFKNRSIYDNKTELVILLRPIVVGGDTWRQEIRKSTDLLEKWYPDNAEDRPRGFVMQGTD